MPAAAPAWQRRWSWTAAIAAVACAVFVLAPLFHFRMAALRQQPPLPASPPREAPPPAPSREPLLESIGSAFASERGIEANIQPYEGPHAMALGDHAFRAELMLADVENLGEPHLRLEWGPKPRAGTAPAAKVVQEPVTSGSETVLTLASDPGVTHPAWRVEGARFLDGINRFRIEAPAGTPPGSAGPSLTLDFTRPRGYPWTALGQRRADPPDTCPAVNAEVDRSDKLYREVEITPALEGLRHALAEQPDCTRALRIYGIVLARGCEIQAQMANKAALSYASALSPFGGELTDRPVWKLWAESTRQFDHWLEIAPSDRLAWRVYGEWMRRTKRPREGLRASRWAVLLAPAIGDSWCHLALTEDVLSQRKQDQGNQTWLTEEQTALAHMDRGIATYGNPALDLVEYREGREAIAKRLKR